MRYSAIIGKGCYRIGLTPFQISKVDTYYLGASHHRCRAMELITQGGIAKTIRFHIELFIRHSGALLRVVSEGDFSEARPAQEGGLEWAEDWFNASRFEAASEATLDRLDPECMALVLPDPKMFDNFPCDIRYQAGEPIPYDLALTAPGKIPEITLMMTATAGLSES